MAGVVPLVVLFVGVLGVSSGSIFARMAEAPSLVICAYRTGIAASILMPFALLTKTKEIIALGRHELKSTLLAGFFLACHFAAWITSLSHTTIASSTALVNTIPVWVVLLGAMRGVRPSRRGAASVLLSCVASAIVCFSGTEGGASTIKGDLLALLGAVFATLYLLCGSEARKKLSLVSYVALCYATAAAFLWAVVLFLGLRVTGYPQATWCAFLGMALCAQILGHSSYNWALRYFSAGFVAIALLGEPIGGALLARLIFKEIPSAQKLLGIALLLIAIVVASRDEAGGKRE